MVHSDSSPDEEAWFAMGAHEEFRELCAVSTSGELSEEEKTRLQEHLVSCAECRKLLREYQAAAHVGSPLFAAASEEPAVSQEQWPASEVEAALQERLRKVDGNLKPAAKVPGIPPNGEQSQQPLLSEHWNTVWLPFAAVILLSTTLGIYAYRAGIRRGAESVPTVSQTRSEQPSSLLQQQLSDAGHERELLLARVAERDGTIAELRKQIEEQGVELKKLRDEEAALQNSQSSSEQEKQRLLASEKATSQKLELVQGALERSQKQLEALEAKRSNDGSEADHLQVKIDDLTKSIKERDSTIDQQRELLSHDRDIRELMGARELYVAEVYDVEKDAATRKPYGRVFFTKGTSLIFYAYDLDRQPGVKKASTFQAWGRHGTDRSQALNLGIFYEDNASKKRWILKFDNPQKLEQIDEVFVTVEPDGGSQKPSGKPFLFAYLKVAPNHP